MWDDEDHFAGRQWADGVHRRRHLDVAETLAGAAAALTALSIGIMVVMVVVLL